MKIKYEFCNEEVEIEVSEEWAAVLADLDREDYNNEHSESRRHCSLEAYDPEGQHLAADDEVEADFIAKMDRKQLADAVASLEPWQQSLIRRVYFDEENIVSIAESENVCEGTIRYRLKKIYAHLKKILEK